MFSDKVFEKDNNIKTMIFKKTYNHLQYHEVHLSITTHWRCYHTEDGLWECVLAALPEASGTEGPAGLV